MVEYGVNPYTVYAFKLIRDHRIPMIKKTNFYGKNRSLIDAMRALEYIGNNTSYDSDLIKNYIDEYRSKGLIGPYFDFIHLHQFVKEHDRIFIYGAGVWGHIAADYLKSKNMEFESYLVTEPADDKALAFDDIKIERTDGIIIAQECKEVCDIIKDHIGYSVSNDQIFTPCYP